MLLDTIIWVHSSTPPKLRCFLGVHQVSVSSLPAPGTGYLSGVNYITRKSVFYRTYKTKTTCLSQYSVVCVGINTYQYYLSEAIWPVEIG